MRKKKIEKYWETWLFFFYDMWHIIMFVFLRISEYLNSIKSRSIRLIDVEWIYYLYYYGTPIWNVIFFITCVEILINCNFFIEVFIEWIICS